MMHEDNPTLKEIAELSEHNKLCVICPTLKKECESYLCKGKRVHKCEEKVNLDVLENRSFET